MLKIAKVLTNLSRHKDLQFLCEFKGVNFARQAVYLLA